MAKVSGLGITGITITDPDGGGAHDISNDMLDFTTTPTISTFDVTGVDKFKHERLGGLADQKIDLTTAFNPVNFKAHRLFRRGLTTARTIVLPQVSTAGGVTGVTQTLGVLINSYGVTRSNTGQLQGKVSLMSQSGTVSYS